MNGRWPGLVWGVCDDFVWEKIAADKPGHDGEGNGYISVDMGRNIAMPKLAANELVLCFGVNQTRTPNIAMMAAA